MIRMNTNTLKRFARETRTKLRMLVAGKLDYILQTDTAALRGAAAQLQKLKEEIANTSREQVIEKVAYTWFNRFMALRFMDANGYNTPAILTSANGYTLPEILQEAKSGQVPDDWQLDRTRLNDLLDGRTAATEPQTDAYKMLIVAACNHWHEAMPFMFERISDYTELLLPDDLLSERSVIADIRNAMTAEDCQQEEIIGWLYQFYIAEKKDEVFAGLAKNQKITPENIPAATQLFTPRWIVCYMVENTIGKIWLAFKPDSNLRQKMPYFIEAQGEAAPLPEDFTGIKDLRFIDPCMGSGHVLVYAFELLYHIYEEEGYNASEIPNLILQNNIFGTDIDPRAAQLAAFALTMRARRAHSRFLRRPTPPQVMALENIAFSKEEQNSIVTLMMTDYYQGLKKKNADIATSHLWKSLKDAAKKEKYDLQDDAFEQLGDAFKSLCDVRNIARYVEKYVEKGREPFDFKVTEIIENELLHLHIIHRTIHHANEFSVHFDTLNQFTNFGSLIVPDENFLYFLQKKENMLHGTQDIFEQAFAQKLQLAIAQFLALRQKYHCVVTNPPYMGGKGMNDDIKDFVQTNFPRSKADLMACFMERTMHMTSENGLMAMINQHSWMFLESYEDLRKKMINTFDINNIVHLGARTFAEISGEVVQSVAFVVCNAKSTNHKIISFRLVSYKDANSKESMFLLKNNKYIINQEEIAQLPSYCILYWINDNLKNSFKVFPALQEIANPRKGLVTTDDNYFLKIWQELSINNICFDNKPQICFLNKKWAPINKGGQSKRWYGNNEYCIRWYKDGLEIKNHIVKKYNGGSYTKEIRSENLYFNESVTWSGISGSTPSFRYNPEGFIFSSSGPSAFPNKEHIKYILGFLNSNVSKSYLELLSPSLSILPGQIGKIPFNLDENELIKITNLVEQSISISKQDWNARETSWDFQSNELIKQGDDNLQAAFEQYKKEWSAKFYELHSHEEELNRQFIDIYGLQDELTPDVPLQEITILQEEGKIIDGALQIGALSPVVQLLSYAVGCMMGRYAIEAEGLVLANQGEGMEVYLEKIPTPRFMPDEDGIIPITEGEYFSDDVVTRCQDFLKAAFGAKHAAENLRFIEDTLGKDLRKFFIKDFYNDHVRRYKKRPIYWLFASPKGHFKALVYLHRYQADTISTLRNDYLLAFVIKLEAERSSMESIKISSDANSSEKAKADKRINELDTMLKDCRAYDKTLLQYAQRRIALDLDDGVKVNYTTLKEILHPIIGL